MSLTGTLWLNELSLAHLLGPGSNFQWTNGCFQAIFFSSSFFSIKKSVVRTFFRLFGGIPVEGTPIIVRYETFRSNVQLTHTKNISTSVIHISVFERAVVVTVGTFNYFFFIQQNYVIRRTDLGFLINGLIVDCIYLV